MYLIMLEKLLGKRHTIMFQYRLLLLALAALYPVWFKTVQQLSGSSEYNFLGLVAIPGIVLAAFACTFFVNRMTNKIYEVYAAMVWLTTAASFFFNAQTEFNPIWVTSSMILIFVCGNTMMTNKSLVYYYVAVTGASALAYSNQMSSATGVHLLGCFTSFALSFISLQGRTSILHHLRHSRDEISKNLDQIEKSAGELAEINRKLDSLVNSLGQAFLIFDESGQCSNIYSKACIKLLETDPLNKNVCEVLKIEDSERQAFLDWVNMVFEEPIPFDELIDMAPQRFDHSAGRIIPLQFFPVRNKEEKITDIVLVATDKTDEIKANESADAERRNAKMINKIIIQKKAFREFLLLVKSHVLKFKEVLRDDVPSNGVIEEFIRFLHTVKGSAGMFFISELEQFVHHMEDEWTEVSNESDLDKEKNRKKIIEDVSAIAEKFFEFIDEHERLLGSSTISEERILELPVSQVVEATQFAKDHKAPEPVVDRMVDLIKEPILESLLQYSHLVVELGNQQGKAILPLNFENGEFKVVPEPFSEVFNSFIHIFRNAVDHGIEEFDERDELGKDFQSRMNVSIVPFMDNNSKWIRILIEDDGRGISPEIIRNRLKEKGHDQLASEEDDKKLIQAIFTKEFSTKEEVTDLSGRGVGLDAVKDSVERLGGRVWVESEVGKGSVFHIELPDKSDQIVEEAQQKVA